MCLTLYIVIKGCVMVHVFALKSVTMVAGRGERPRPQRCHRQGGVGDVVLRCPVHLDGKVDWALMAPVDTHYHCID